ncbi:hypothetical protein E2C01_035201 [Portunus trituberculatus]|uniref:Uncharacterized protein n=1 Tax=Portunus trituberculatus TaxID=210409 RepID=A0A5B7F2J6_PORTR|nr:hypothetical protein [Portunus trituberculatus]
MSSIRVLVPHDGKETLVAFAHTLDANTLPSPAALKCHDGETQSYQMPMCDHNAGERAMVIKTHRGDWAVLVGTWSGLRPGIPGTRMKRGQPGSPGQLVVRFHCPPSATAVTMILPYNQQYYTFNMHDLEIDMRNGVLKVNAGTEEWVENIALGLSITVLHVLCQPRIAEEMMQDTVDGALGNVPDTLTYPRRIPVENLKMLGAMGFFCAAAPTNARRRNVNNTVNDTVTATCTSHIVAGNIGAGCGACVMVVIVVVMGLRVGGTGVGVGAVGAVAAVVGVEVSG